MTSMTFTQWGDSVMGRVIGYMLLAIGVVAWFVAAYKITKDK